MAWLIAAILAVALIVMVFLWWRARSSLADVQSQLWEASSDRSAEVGPSLTQLSTALDETSSAVVIVDADGEVVHRNRSAEPFADARHGDALILQSINERLDHALSGRSTEDSVSLVGPPARVVSTSGRPLVLDGELIGAVAVVDDLTEHQRVADLRRDFVANVSHELKTPVGALSLLAETLVEETDPAIVSRFASRVHGEAMRLDQLINDLLDLSRVEAGSDLASEVLDAREILDEAVALVRPAAVDRGIDLDVDLGREMMVRGDRSQLVSAVRNVLENAVKYTESDGAVSASIAGDEDEAVVTVVDTGRGIPAGDIDRIFERFYRVDRARSTETGGTGLGLSIVRNVMNNHGGRVEVISQEGTGSTFTLTLPRATT